MALIMMLNSPNDPVLSNTRQRMLSCAFTTQQSITPIYRSFVIVHLRQLAMSSYPESSFYIQKRLLKLKLESQSISDEFYLTELAKITRSEEEERKATQAEENNLI